MPRRLSKLSRRTCTSFARSLSPPASRSARMSLTQLRRSHTSRSCAVSQGASTTATKMLHARLRRVPLADPQLFDHKLVTGNIPTQVRITIVDISSVQMLIRSIRLLRPICCMVWRCIRRHVRARHRPNTLVLRLQRSTQVHLRKRCCRHSPRSQATQGL